MKTLSSENLDFIVGGSSTPAPCTTGSNGNQTCSCPTGTYPAHVNGQIVCAKPD